jgi:hypothetical protein
MNKQIAVNVQTIIDAETIVASGSYETSAIDLGNINGTMSLQYAITGDGTLKITYTVSNDGVNYVLPTGGADIAANLTKSSGTSGKDIIAFTPPLAKFLKIKATETGTSNSATITLTAAIK